MLPIVRVTQLECYRRFKDHVSDYDTEDNLVASLTGAFTGNSYTRIGSAFHLIAEKGDVIGTEIDGVMIDEAQRRTMLDYRNSLLPSVNEVRLYKKYNTSIGEVFVTGCADKIHGNVIHDIKTKYSTVCEADYRDSCQWRFYLDLFGLDDFSYDLFQFTGYKGGLDVRGLPMVRLDSIPVQRYRRMTEDNRSLIDGFMKYASDNNLIRYLKI